MKSSVWKRNRGKILIAIAALLIAMTAAIGSGAYFSTSATNGPNVFTAGTLTLNGPVANLNVGPLFPGHAMSGILTVTNTNPVDVSLTLTQSNLAGALEPGVDVTIRNGATVLFGPARLSTFPAGGLPVGTLAASGGSVTLTWDALLPETGVSQDAYQGTTMSADYTWTIQSL